jgi:predicted ABC-type ATPase
VVGGWTARVHDDVRPQLLLLGGRSGSGKTTVAHEVSARLRKLGVAHCHVEGDNLDAAYPKAADDPRGRRLTEMNLAALWRNYRAIGHHRLIYVNTASVLGPQMITRAMGTVGLGAVHLVAVELTARDETVAARLAAREGGSALAWHVERSRHMAHVLAQQSPPTTLRVGTDDRDVTSVAAEVIDLSGWAGPHALRQGPRSRPRR